MNRRVESLGHDSFAAQARAARSTHSSSARVVLLIGTAALLAACGTADTPVRDAAADPDAASVIDAADPADAAIVIDAVAAPDANLLCPSDMAYVPTASVCIDRYEASHAVGNIAMSNPGVTPWSLVTWPEAQAGCAAAGKRLCDEAEWTAACVGPAPGTLYPYGGISDYTAHTCNGADHDVGAPVNTGSIATCEGGFPGIFDMSGNMFEWTSACTTTCAMRGGSFSTGGDHITLRCGGSTEWVTTGGTAFIGFRCCMTPPD
jgi:hypothetical protein